MIRAALSLSLLGALAVAQDNATSAPSESSSRPRYVAASRAWSIVLPTRWRQLTPDEAKRLREASVKLLPADLLRPIPGRDYCLGPVADWLTGKSDGASLSVHEFDEEPAIGETMLRELRNGLEKQAAAAGITLRFLRLEQKTRGPDRHKVAEAELELQLEPNGPLFRTLEIYAPTSGRLVALRFRAPATSWPESAPTFETALDTVTFAKPASVTETQSKGSTVMWAAIFGAVAGIVLVQVRKHSRRA